MITDTLPEFVKRGSPERDSELILSLVASGLVGMVHWRGDVDRRRPYDGRLQLGLDRLAVACSREGLKPPTGVADLVWDWSAERSVRQWPLRLDEDAEVGDERLLVGGEPSEFCREWVCAASDVMAEIHESALVEHVKDVARALGRPELYAQWRLILTEHSVLSATELLQWKNAHLDVAPWPLWLDDSYEPIPVEATVDGQNAICRGCHQSMTPNVTTRRWSCPSWRCDVRQDLRDPVFKPSDGMFRLRSDLVRFVALPGQPELGLARALARRGARVVLYPGLDALDLLATWPDGYAIGVDLKDWRFSSLLAKKIKQFPRWPKGHPYAYSDGFVAIPNDRTRGHPEYLKTLRKRSTALRAQPHVHAITDAQLISQCPNVAPPGEVTCGP
ncbi:hypothetical protein QIS99_00025 [Streptomyces sp. B-S-A8]|uniref:REase associating with pPIWI RE domain-containing protein n=1 Tax=Streptomyces solicavernae TaxID=3043614 RepID=A0ABT6RJL4_9ACTN|nr:hypothetical protein [Streptomyces sp. B-S-A8]MDI3384617.1 hypothetical protein [Streptomyces sp. B-S-A8]